MANALCQHLRPRNGNERKKRKKKSKLLPIPLLCNVTGIYEFMAVLHLKSTHSICSVAISPKLFLPASPLRAFFAGKGRSGEAEGRGRSQAAAPVRGATGAAPLGPACKAGPGDREEAGGEHGQALGGDLLRGRADP